MLGLKHPMQCSRFHRHWTINSTQDPVLDEVVSKLQRMEFDLKEIAGPQATVKPGGFKVEMKGLFRGQEGGCVCQRPLQLVMCGLCGETFPGQLAD